MAPHVNAFLLAEHYEETADGRPVIVGVYPPALRFRSFPSNFMNFCLFAQLLEIQSAEEASRLRLVGTHRLEGRVVLDQPLYSAEALAPLRARPCLPVDTVNFHMFLPEVQFTAADVFVFKLVLDGKELARVSIEAHQA